MNLLNLRKSKGITQRKLALDLNVSQACVAMWENGLSSPRSDKLPKLAENLGCSIADLFEPTTKGA